MWYSFFLAGKLHLPHTRFPATPPLPQALVLRFSPLGLPQYTASYIEKLTSIKDRLIIQFMTRHNPYGPPAQHIPQPHSIKNQPARTPVQSTDSTLAEPARTLNHKTLAMGTAVSVLIVAATGLLLLGIFPIFRPELVILAVGCILPALWYSLIYLLKVRPSEARLSHVLIGITTLLILFTGILQL